MSDQKRISLGIDLGTTSVKISLVDIDAQCLVFSTSEPTQADIPKSDHPEHAEQDVSKIFRALCACLTQVTENNRSNICCISVSGQMHGVTLWNTEAQEPISESNIQPCSSTLITWEDKRATKEFLNVLPEPDSHLGISSGFGCVTLFWVMKNSPEMLVHFDTAGGVMDYFTMLLCGLDKPVMSSQIAASWGYFNTDNNSWNHDILKEAGFPVHMLPVVVEGGTKVGSLCKDWFGIRCGTPVLAGLGDLQCSFLSAVQTDTDAVLNISTSSQVCYAVKGEDFIPPRPELPTPVTHFPFFRRSYLAVAASLNGGNVLGAFVQMLQQWFKTFGIEISKEQIWTKLTKISTQASPPSSSTDFLMPIIQPLLYGERHIPEASASITGITESVTSLDCVFRSLCAGLVNNLHLMMPQSLMIESGVTRLVVTGSVVHKQPCVREHVCKLYMPLPVVEISEIDAAYGAALVGVKHLCFKTE